jgi:hypothetical protein
MRIYNPSLGRFLSVDPLAAKYSYLTPYQFASNRPIDGIDLDGLEYISANTVINQETGETFGGTFGSTISADDVIERNGTTYYRVHADYYVTPEGLLSTGSDNQRNTRITQWFDDPVEPVISSDQNESYDGNCYDAANSTCSNGGAYTAKGTWNPNNQMYTEDGSGVSDQTKANGKYAIDKALYKYDKPIMVGVDYHQGNPGNADGTTDHYIVIVGKGFDEETQQVFYTYYDNVGSNKTDVVANRLYLMEDGTLQDSNTWSGSFTVTEVRPSSATKK